MGRGEGTCIKNGVFIVYLAGCFSSIGSGQRMEALLREVHARARTLCPAQQLSFPQPLMFICDRNAKAFFYPAANTNENHSGHLSKTRNTLK